MSYVASCKAQVFYSVSELTLRRWAKKGKIDFTTTNGGHRRYFIPNSATPNKFVYCRVSSDKQKQDLERQVKFMHERYPDYTILQDVGSGLNFKRKHFLSLLQQVFERNVSEIVVASPDRFVRFNFDFFEWLCEQHGCKLKTLRRAVDKSPEQELSEDLLSIITIFVARNNGRRRYSIEKSKDPNLA